MTITGIGNCTGSITKTFTINPKKLKASEITIKNLGSKKTYYVRVRTYKTSGGKNYYSEWSAKKTVKTK